MKTKIIALLLFCIPFLSNGQTPVVQKLINGKICNTCYVKYNMFSSNILPYLLIGTYTNHSRLYPEKKKFDDLSSTISKNSKQQTIFDSERHITNDSIFNLVYLTYPENDYKYGDKNYDYKNVEILIEKNQKQIKDWQILHQLPSVEGYKINRINIKRKIK